MNSEKLRSLGVVVGRFQIPELHDGHLHLLDTVAKQHRQMLILLGCSLGPIDLRDPYNFEVRMLMLRGRYPAAHVLPLLDSAEVDEVASNRDWSDRLDAAVRVVAPTGQAVLYGSRDSFIPKYHGQFVCEELPEVPNVSATQVRNSLSDEALDSPEYRKGWYDCLRIVSTDFGEHRFDTSKVTLLSEKRV